jgi:hypothetical protein
MRRSGMQGSRWQWLWSVALAASLLVAACSSPDFALAPASAPASAPAESSSYDRSGAAPAAQEASAGMVDGIATQRKIIAKANIDLVVADSEVAVDEITNLVQQVGGYVSSANLYKSGYGSGDLLRGTLTLRVPADALDSVLDQLEQLAVDVRSRNLDRQDITDEYSDISAQIRNLELTEQELQELLAEVRAKPNAKPEDIMSVYRTIAEVRGQIEQLMGRRNMYDNLVALSTIQVSLTPDVAGLPVLDSSWRPAIVAREAFGTLVVALQGLGDFVIWAVIFIAPVLAIILSVLALFFWIARGVLRRISRRNKVATPAAGS